MARCRIVGTACHTTCTRNITSTYLLTAKISTISNSEDRYLINIEQWKDLTTDDLEGMGFKEGHARKFVKKAEEHFTNIIGNEQGQNDMVITEEMEEEGVTFTNL